MKLSAEDKMGLSPEEIKVLESLPEDGSVPGEAGTPASTPASPPASATAKAEDASTEGDPDEKDDPDAGDAGADAGTPASLTEDEIQAAISETQHAAPKTFEVGKVDEIADQRKQLRADKRDIETQWASGNLTDEERSTKIAEIDDKLDELLIQATRASTLQEINQQNAADEAKRAEEAMNVEIVRVIKAAQADKSIDYPNDQLAQAQFDAIMTQVRATEAGAKLSVRELVDQTHAAVLAIRGVKPAASSAPAPAAKREAPTPPVTLAAVPSAAPVHTMDDVMARFKTLQGDEAEAFMASLPPREQQRLLKLADSMH